MIPKLALSQGHDLKVEQNIPLLLQYGEMTIYFLKHILEFKDLIQDSMSR